MKVYMKAHMENHKNDNQESRHVLKKTRSRFLSGLLVLVPIAVTIFVIRFMVGVLASIGRPVLMIWMDEVPQLAVDALAFLMALVLIYGVGLFATHITGRRLVKFGENMLLKLPLVKSIYGASKNVVDAFSKDAHTTYEAVALVEFPRRGARAIGFVMGSMLNNDGVMIYRVYVPTAPNPTSGFLLLLPENEVEFTDMPVETALKTILSGGSLGPDQYRFTERPAPATDLDGD